MSSSSRKKQKSEVRVTASLACHALAIVLQHWMIPDIGWYSQSCEQFVRVLERDLQTQSQGRKLNEEFLDEHRRQCQNNLQNADLLIDLLPANQTVAERRESVIKRINDVIDAYYVPYSNVLKYNAFTNAITLRHKYYEHHHHITTWIHALGKRSATSVIVYQCIAWQSYYTRYGELIELLIFNMVIYAYLLHTQRHTILKMIQFPVNDRDSVELMDHQTVQDMINRVKSVLLVWMIPLTNVNKLIEHIDSINNVFHTSDSYSTVLTKLFDASKTLLNLFYELNDGDSSGIRSTKYRSLPGSVAQNSAIRELNECHTQYKLCLSQSIYCNIELLLARTYTVKNNSLTLLGSIFTILDTLYEDLLTTFAKKRILAPYEFSPLTTDAVGMMSKALALSKRCLVHVESGQIIGTLHKINYQITYELCNFMIKYAKLCDLTVENMSPNPLFRPSAVKIAPLYQRAIQICKKGYALNVEHYDDLLVRRQIKGAEFFDHMYGEALVYYYHDPRKLVSITTMRDKLINVYRNESHSFMKRIASSNGELLLDVIEMEIDCYEQAMQLVYSISSESTLTIDSPRYVKAMDDLCIHRWVADLCYYLSAFLHLPESSKQFEDGKKYHSLWFEWRAIELSLEGSSTTVSVAALAIVKLILKCIKFRIMVLGILNWDESPDETSEYLKKLINESLTIDQIVASSLIDDWFNLLKDAFQALQEAQCELAETVSPYDASCRINQIEDCFFWLEKRLEVAMLLLDLDTANDARGTGRKKISKELQVEQLSKVQWIVEYGNDYPPKLLVQLYNGISNFLECKKVDNHKDLLLVKWLLGPTDNVESARKERSTVSALLKEVVTILEEARRNAYSEFLSEEEESIRNGSFGPIVSYESVLSLFYKLPYRP